MRSRHEQTCQVKIVVSKFNDLSRIFIDILTFKDCNSYNWQKTRYFLPRYTGKNWNSILSVKLSSVYVLQLMKYSLVTDGQTHRRKVLVILVLLLGYGTIKSLSNRVRLYISKTVPLTYTWSCKVTYWKDRKRWWHPLAILKIHFTKKNEWKAELSH